jgi:glycosyltransferase involved in cell wall biosynthesis
MQLQSPVSVIIPAYNAAATIARALDSALAQTYPRIEVIVVDDCSEDATSDVVSAYDDPRIRLFRLRHNHGEGGAVNHGITHATGEYIAFLDADDEWLPDKLERQMPLLLANPKATLVTCGCRVFDREGRPTDDLGMPAPRSEKGEIWRDLLAASYIFKPCVVTRAAALRRVGPFDTTVRIAADQDMWIRLAMEGDVEFVPDLLTIVYDTPGSLTKVYAGYTDRYVLPMIHRHIARRRRDLSKQEIRHILGERYTNVGRTVYRSGATIRGAVLLLRAITLRNRIGENLCYLIVASPLAQAMKRRNDGMMPTLSREQQRPKAGTCR